MSVSDFDKVFSGSIPKLYETYLVPLIFDYFKAHAPRGFWPIMNFGELAALYSFLFLFVAARGSGRYSFDALLRKRRL